MAGNTSVETDRQEKWRLAKEGINLLINNKGKEAETLFLQHEECLQMYAGYSIVTFLDAVMTFEDDKLALAMSTLKELERRCTVEKGWFKTMKKVFGAETTESLADYLESQVILADSLVFLATLTFLQHDLSGYFKGGWILRKSWKLYQQTYFEISKLYKEIIGDPNLPDLDFQSPAPNNLKEETANNIFDLEDASFNKDDIIDPESFEVLPSPPIDGYRPYSSSLIPNTPKQSFSCYENLSSYSNSSNYQEESKEDSLLLYDNNNKKKVDYHNCIGVDPKTSPSSTATSRTSSFKSKMKKSATINNALSFRTLEKTKNFASKLSPFSSNLSLSYFTNFSLFSSTEKIKNQDLDKATISRLMGAVCFGYGLFQLGVSLLPPTLLKLTNILGFSGNRQTGIENLMFARLGTDMRAPLATLALLWFHTIVRPFYALDGSNVQAGVEAAVELINESLKDYEESALFLFFRGRVSRLKSDIPAALNCFQKSVENATQREMKILSKHELGWCSLIQLDYAQAELTFQYMKTCSRWSRAFYSYLATISAGANNNIRDFSILKEMHYYLEKAPKGTQLEEFLLRRFRICPKDEEALKNTSDNFWKMLVYELLYLWNTLPSCNTLDIANILTECEFSKEEEVMIGLSKLLSGVCHCIQKNYESGMHSLRYCLELRKGLPYNAPDAHISAFAQYELGLLLLQDETTKQEGKQLLQQVNLYKEYDFEQRLSVRIHMILKHL